MCGTTQLILALNSHRHVNQAARTAGTHIATKIFIQFTPITTSLKVFNRVKLIIRFENAMATGLELIISSICNATFCETFYDNPTRGNC
jgi:hypothetical protein